MKRTIDISQYIPKSSFYFSYRKTVKPLSPTNTVCVVFSWESMLSVLTWPCVFSRIHWLTLASNHVNVPTVCSSFLTPPWWRHQMETFSALLAICAGKSPVTAQRPATRGFDVFFDLLLNKRLSKQWWGWWFETPSHPLWYHCDTIYRAWSKSHRKKTMIDLADGY